METKEFENVKVIFVPKLGIIGLVESNKGPDTIIYSTDVDSNGNNLLIVSVILRGSSLDMGYEVTGKAKGRLLDEILNTKFKGGYFMVIDGEVVLKESLNEIEAGWHLCDIRYKFGRRYKDNNKSMKTKEIFIPFYLEYAYCIESELDTDYPIFVFGTADKDYFYVKCEEDCISCTKSESSTDWRDLIMEDDGRFDVELEPLWKMLLNKSFDNINFKLYWGNEDCTNRITKNDKNQFLLAILNCLDMNFSHKSMITDSIPTYWYILKKTDEARFQNQYKEEMNDNLLERLMCIKGGYYSDKIYEHFKNYSMKRELGVGKINGVRDIKDGINFVKLDAVGSQYGGDFDLVGLKEGKDGKYTLVVREVSKDDLSTYKYRNLSCIEKNESLWGIVDGHNINITEVLIQGTTKSGIWEETRTNDVSGYLNTYIDKIFESGSNGGDCTLGNVKGSREFVDLIIDQLTKLKGKLYRVEDKIDFDNSRPIMYNLMSINKHLDNLNSKN